MSTPHEELEVMAHVDQAVRSGVGGAAAIAERAARRQADRDRVEAARLRDEAWQRGEAPNRVPGDAPTPDPYSPTPRPEQQPTPRPEQQPTPTPRPESSPATVAVQQVADAQAARDAVRVEAEVSADSGMQTTVIAAHRANTDRGVSPTKATTPEEAQHRRQTWQIAQREWSAQQGPGEGTQQAWDRLPMKQKTDLYWQAYDTPQARTVHIAGQTPTGQVDHGFSPDRAGSSAERDRRVAAWDAARAEFHQEHPELSQRQAAAAFDKLDWQDKALRYWGAYDSASQPEAPARDRASVPEESEPTIPLPRVDGRGDRPVPTAQGETVSRERVIELNQAAAEWFTTQATPASKGGAYLQERLGAEVLNEGRWQLGYAPQGWTGLTEHLRATQAATDAELVAAGLGTKSSRGNVIDTFRDRAMIGVRNTAGETVGFVGRDLSGEARAKYLNTTSTPAFTKGEQLLGIHEAPRGASLYRVEGPFDAIAITAAGRGKAAGVAPMGTALTDAQADLIAVHSVDQKVYSALDDDAAGRRATAKDYWMLTDRGLDVRSVTLPASDPAEAWQTSPDTLRTALDHEDVWPSAATVVVDELVVEGGAALAAGEDQAVVTYFDRVDDVADRAPEVERDGLGVYAEAALAGAAGAVAVEAVVEEVERIEHGREQATPAQEAATPGVAYDRAKAADLGNVIDPEAVQARTLSAAAFSQPTATMLAGTQQPGHTPAAPAGPAPAIAPAVEATRTITHRM